MDESEYRDWMKKIKNIEGRFYKLLNTPNIWLKSDMSTEKGEEYTLIAISF